MNYRHTTILACACACALSLPGTAMAAPLAHPLLFFDGVTESVGTMKAMMKHTQHVRSVGHGTISADGILTLVQQVEDEGEKPHQRVWRIHRVGPTKFVGTMSEAVGAVTVDQVDAGYRFRFRMPGGLSVEQWLFPLSDGKSGIGKLIVRKFGMIVAKSETTIRRLSQEGSSAR